jgi:hypothetical protein
MNKAPLRRCPRPDDPPRPVRAPPPDALPSSVTFFVTAAQRRALLARLREIHHDRAAALFAALGIDPKGNTP